MNAAEPWKPKWAMHPGEIVLEFVANHNVPLGILARLARVEIDYVIQVCLGWEPLNERLASGLARVTDGQPPKSLWLNLQRDYDDAKARQGDQDRQGGEERGSSPFLPELMGTGEVRRCLGLKWSSGMRDKLNFPAPIAELLCGPIWMAEDIRRYKRERIQGASPPRS